jgi:hypothetical protein
VTISLTQDTVFIPEINEKLLFNKIFAQYIIFKDYIPFRKQGICVNNFCYFATLKANHVKLRELYMLALDREKTLAPHWPFYWQGMSPR